MKKIRLILAYTFGFVYALIHFNNYKNVRNDNIRNNTVDHIIYNVPPLLSNRSISLQELGDFEAIGPDETASSTTGRQAPCEP